MAIQWRLAPCSLLLVAGLLLTACNEPRDPSSYHGQEWVTVNFDLHGGAGSQPQATGVLGSEIGSSLIMVYPEATPLTPFPWTMPAPIDSAMLDTATSSVQLTVPTGTSLQLVEYVFNDALTRADVDSRIAVPGGPNVSAPFTIASGTSTTVVQLPVTTMSFAEGLNDLVTLSQVPLFAVPMLDPLRWNAPLEGLIKRDILPFGASNVLELMVLGRDTVYRARVRPIALAAPPTQMSADVTLLTPFGPGTWARLAGRFYHASLPGEAAGDATGDIFAQIYLDGTNASYFVGQCLANACTGPAFNNISGFTPIAAVPAGTTANLSLRVDPATGVFTFSVGVGGAVNSVSFDAGAAGYAPTAPTPNSPFVEVGDRLAIGPGQASFMVAYFDNVVFDNTLYDTFETPTGLIDLTKWDAGTSSVSIDTTGSIPTLHLMAAASTTGNPAIDTNGSRAQLFDNINQRLNSHRIAGNLSLPSLPAVVEDPQIINSQPVNARAVARLHYQPRADRDNGSVHLTGIEVGIFQNGTLAPFPVLNAFGCLDATCSTFLSFPGIGQFSTPARISTNTPYPFSLEYVGGNRVRAVFNGEARVVDLSSAPFFNPNDFVGPVLRAQVRRAFDPLDSGIITADFSALEIGQPGTPTFPAGSLLPAGAVAYDDFNLPPDQVTGLGQLDPSRWREVRQFKRALNGAGQLQVDLVSQTSNQTQNNIGTNLTAIVPAGTTGFRADVTFPVQTFPDPAATGVSYRAGIDGELFLDTLGNTITGRIALNSDGTVDYSIDSCAPNQGQCTNLTGAKFGPPPVTLGTPTKLGLFWDPAAGTVTFTQDGNTIGPLGLGPVPAATQPTGPQFSLETSANPATDGVTVAKATMLYGNVEVTKDGLLYQLHDDFLGGPNIDLTKWEEGDATAVVDPISQVFELFSFGSFLGLDLPDPITPPAIAADVTVATATGDGAVLLYKGAYQSGTNNVIGLIGMSGTQVFGAVVSCPNSDCPLPVSLGVFPVGTVTPGTPHRLYIQYDGGWFAFQLDDLPPVVVDPVPLAPNTGAVSGFGGGFLATSFSTVGAGGFTRNGTVSATIDRVFIDLARPVPLP